MNENEFVLEHLQAMLQDLMNTGQPQSAVAYWRSHGDPTIKTHIWLYLLDYYVLLQEDLESKKGTRLSYCLTPSCKPYEKHSANRVVYDLWLEHAAEE